DVTVIVTDPLSKTTKVPLQPTGPGLFSGTFTTAFPGLHQCRFLATGFTGRGEPFQREETRTVSAFRDRIPEGVGSERDDARHKRPVGHVPTGKELVQLLEEDRPAFCRLLDAAVEDEQLAGRIGLEGDRLKAYLERYCRDVRR